jgi:hypothetical protein
VSPSVKAAEITYQFTFDEVGRIMGLWSTTWKTACDGPCEHIPASHAGRSGVPASAPTPRFVSRQRVLYRADDLSRLLDPGRLLRFSSFAAPECISEISTGSVPVNGRCDGLGIWSEGET